MMYEYFHNLFLAADQLANALIGGDPDETISSRLGKCQRGDHGRAVRWLMMPLAWLVDLLFAWQGWGHCRRVIEDDEGGRELLFKKRGES